MDHKAVVVAIDIGGGIRLKLDRDVGHRGVELEVGPRAAVLAQDVGCQVIAIIEGQKVILTQVEPKEKQEKISSTCLPSYMNEGFYCVFYIIGVFSSR